MVMDFNEIKDVVSEKVIEPLDHKNLNDIFQNPTVENIALWIFHELSKEMPLYSVELWEGHGKWVEVCVDDLE